MSLTRTLTASFDLYLAEHPHRARQLHVWVCVSGGVDSTTLWHELHDRRIAQRYDTQRLHLLHYDHAQRETSARDRTFVQTLSRHHPTHIEIYEGRASDEQSLRSARYSFFGHTIQRLTHNKQATTTNVLVLGHHLDDRIETSLMHMMRGSHVRGITNMQMRAPPSLDLQSHGIQTIYRPLLDTQKHEILTHARLCDYTRHDDETNTDPTVSRRNLLRLDILPHLISHSHGDQGAARYRSWRHLYSYLDETSSSLPSHTAQPTNSDASVPSSSASRDQTGDTSSHNPTNETAPPATTLIDYPIPAPYSAIVRAWHSSPRPPSPHQLTQRLRQLGCNYDMRHQRRADLYAFCTADESSGYTYLATPDADDECGWHIIRAYDRLMRVYAPQARRSSYRNASSITLRAPQHADPTPYDDHHTPPHDTDTATDTDTEEETIHYTLGGLDIDLPTILPAGATLRFARTGDKKGSKSFGTRCNNHKIPLCFRPIIPIVEDNNEIIFVFIPPFVSA